MHDTLIIIIIIALIYLFSEKTLEYFSMDNKERTNIALQALANVYNSNDIVVGELTTTKSFNLLPRGTIAIWGNPDKLNPIKIPDGWVLCDGNNNTPDLRNKFVLGGDLTFTNVSNLTGGNVNTTLTTEQLPAHTHNYDDIFFSLNINSLSGPDANRAPWTYVPGGIGTSRDIKSPWGGFIRGNYDQDNVGWGINRTSKPTGEGKSISIMPQYYKLVHIMKT